MNAGTNSTTNPNAAGLPAGAPALRLRDTGPVQVGAYRVERLALGAMRLLSSSFDRDGRHHESFGLPADAEASRRVMRAAVEEYGIGYVDFARGYGPTAGSGESFFRAWMSPYPANLLWATKVGYERDAQGGWGLNLAPESIARDIAASASELGAAIPLLYLVVGSTSDVTVRNRPARLADAFAALVDARARGVAANLGVANVTAAELAELLEVAPVAAVQNKFTVASLADPAQVAVLDLCRRHGIAFVAWGIFQADGPEAWEPGVELTRAASELGVSPQEASIAILLHAESHLVALTGASRRSSLESSVRAANLTVPGEIVARFTAKAVR